MTASNIDKISETVRAAIAQTLRVPLEQVKSDSNLAEDLEAESIDFAEIIHWLQTEFKIELYPGGVFSKLEELFGDGVLAKKGKLTDVGAKVMRERMPELDPSKIAPGMWTYDIQMLFTTATWARAVQEILEARPRVCPNCDSDRLQPTRISHLACAECETEVKCPTHEEVIETWARPFLESAPDATR